MPIPTDSINKFIRGLNATRDGWEELFEAAVAIDTRKKDDQGTTETKLIGIETRVSRKAIIVDKKTKVKNDVVFEWDQMYDEWFNWNNDLWKAAITQLREQLESVFK